jgi:dolichyl-phosphate-mannose--protein O-mannosyl transferase
VAVVSSVAWPILQDFSSALEVALVLFSICMLLFSIFMILVFSLRYKFRLTGTSEPENAFIPEDFLDHGHPRKWEARRNEAPPVASQRKE